MYFPNAFKKAFLPKTRVDGVSGLTEIDLVTAGKTDALTAGQIGLFDSKTYTAISAAPGSGNQTFILAQGSYFTADKIGPFHGGYKESVKSKVINPKYISRFFKVTSKTAQNQIVTVAVSNVYEDETVRLRVDVKGSPALRFLSHNLYKTLDAYTGCAADASNKVLVDPTMVVAAYAKQINEDPILSKFISAAAKDSTGAAVADLSNPTLATGITAATDAELVLTVAYADTKFGDCTFTVTDHYELEPLFVYTSLVDESGEPCADKAVAVQTETQAPRQASGIGETVIRDLILDGRYRQEAYHDSFSAQSALRLREIEANPGLKNIDRSGLYDQVCILHNVPRLMNPSSTFDNDQYLLVIHVPAGTDTTEFTNLVQGFLTTAGNGVTLESF